MSLWVADTKKFNTSSWDQVPELSWYSNKSPFVIYHSWYSTCIGTLPRSLSSPCIVVEGKTMLCGRNGLVGLVPIGLCGAYEKYFDRGERAVLCCGKEGINKNCKAAWGKMPPMFEATAKDVCVCVACVYELYRWLSAYHWAVSPSVIQSRQGLQDIKGNKSYLIKAISTLPPSFRWLDYLNKRWLTNQSSFVTYSNSSQSNYGCVPLVFLLVAQRVHCCFEPQSHNCSSKVSHPQAEGYFHFWNRNVSSNMHHV